MEVKMSHVINLEVSEAEYQFLDKLSEIAEESADYCNDSYESTLIELLGEILYQWKNDNHKIVLENWVK